MKGKRSQGRAYALQVLYGLDHSDAAAKGAAATVGDLLDLQVDDASAAFAQKLVQQTRDSIEDIDSHLVRVSKNWRLERMAYVDRNILRLAACELIYYKEVPAKVIINEAVELAKVYGAAGASSFVNGVLDRLAQDLRARGGEG